MLPSLSRPMRERLQTIAIGLAGALVFRAVGLPLPFLFGPMFACLIAALAGAKMRGMGIVAAAGRTILGVAVGSTVTPEVVAQVPQMALSVALVPIYIIAIALVGLPFFQRVYGFDRVTAWYAAMPGGLQDMVVFGREAGADVRALSLIHATRVAVLLTIAPILLTFGFGESLHNPIGVPATVLPLGEMALMVVAALVGWKGGERVRLFGATIIGPMILTATFSMMGLIHHRPPAEAIIVAQFLIGIGIGVGYVGVTLPELRRDVAAGLVFVLVLAALATGFAELVVQLGLARPIEGFLAFAPGGQADMTILAIATGADLGFIIVHHLTRLVVVILGAPIAARLLRISPPTGGVGPEGEDARTDKADRR